MGFLKFELTIGFSFAELVFKLQPSKYLRQFIYKISWTVVSVELPKFTIKFVALKHRLFPP
jgi:hypothetical protein